MAYMKRTIYHMSKGLRPMSEIKTFKEIQRNGFSPRQQSSQISNIFVPAYFLRSNWPCSGNYEGWLFEPCRWTFFAFFIRVNRQMTLNKSCLKLHQSCATQSSSWLFRAEIFGKVAMQPLHMICSICLLVIWNFIRAIKR